MTTVIAVVAAVAAAFCFAVASIVQQSVARASGADEVMRPRLLLDLARRPRWLAGIGLDAMSFLILALALAFGPLALVQPLASLDVLFALPLIARRQRRRLTLQDGIGAMAVAAGIVIFLAVATPTGGVGAPTLADWAPLFLAAGLLSALSALAGLRVRGKARVVWLAAAAGSIYGVLDALAKATVDVASMRGLGFLATWEPYALLLAGLVGALLGQSAFSSGALSLSLPVLGTLAPITAVVIAATVFGEQLATSTWQLGLQMAGGATAVAGIAVLSRSSIVAAETREVRDRPLVRVRSIVSDYAN
ncbi:MAG TPA: DMT family transporter [Streptosporangiaceae bacterium]|nr:DMT family transporter [Streptosporangiaceae bacterium]